MKLRLGSFLILLFGMSLLAACGGREPAAIPTPTATHAAVTAPPAKPTAAVVSTPTPISSIASPTSASTPIPDTRTPEAPQLSRINLMPIRDNTLYEDEMGIISNGKGQHLFAGMTKNASIHRAVIAFDIAGRIPPGSRIVSARLVLNLSKTTSGAEEAQLLRLLADWGEGASDAPENEGGGFAAADGDATWIHRFYPIERWKAPGGDFSQIASGTTMVAGPGAYTWGSTPEMVADIQDWLDRPANNFGWLLRGNESKNPTSKRFDSRENENEASRPMLAVEFQSSEKQTPTPTSTPRPTPTPTSRPTPVSTPTVVAPTAAPGRQEFAEIENYRANQFYPESFVALKGIPFRLYITRLHREHVNRFTIEPFVRSTGFFAPGKMGFIEFTPDRAGKFRIRNEGHGYEASLDVVNSEDERRQLWARRGVQEFSLIHNFAESQVAPNRLVVQLNLPVRIYNTGLGGKDKVSIPPLYIPAATNVDQGKITVIEFTPTIAGEFPIVYEQHNLVAILVVQKGP